MRAAIDANLFVPNQYLKGYGATTHDELLRWVGRQNVRKPDRCPECGKIQTRRKSGDWENIKTVGEWREAVIDFHAAQGRTVKIDMESWFIKRWL